MTTEINRFRFLTKTTDNISIKESAILFKKGLERTGTTDLIINVVFFYAFAIGTTVVSLKDISGVKHLSAFFIVLILILLFIPWLLKYQHNQRYKKIYSILKDTVNYLDEVS